MRRHLAAAALAVAAPLSAQATFDGGSDFSDTDAFNRLELENGHEVIWVIQAPFVGAPAWSFDPTGDLYWKVYPAEALRRCGGTANLMGLEDVNLADTDLFSSEAIWAYTITPGVAGTDGTILPTFGGQGVFVPGTSTTGEIFGSGHCSYPIIGGYVSGWVYNEVFLTTTGATTPLLELTADGTIDWVFTHYFPAPGFADMDLLNGPLNSCGSTGDATLQWHGSTDGHPSPNAKKGENQPDWTGLGNSIYGGFNVGGSGAFAPISEPTDRGAEISWLFDEPTMTLVVDTDNGDGFPKPERGLAALQTPLQISGAGAPGPGTTTLGVGLGVEHPAPTHVMIAAVNVGPTLLDLGGGCIDLFPGSLALNPADPAFLSSLIVFGVAPFLLDFSGGGLPRWYAETPQVPLGAGPAWIDLTLSWQAWQFDVASEQIVGTSQVFQNTLRTNDGLP